MQWTAFFVLLLVTGEACAQNVEGDNKRPWDGEPFRSEPRALLRVAAALPARPEADFDLLFQEQHIRFDAKGRKTLRHRHLFRVLSRRAAEAMGNAEWSWAPWHQERPVVQARIITADGQAHILDPKTAVEVPYASGDGKVFSNRRLLRAPLPGVEPGAVIEEVWLETDLKPLFEAGAVTVVDAQWPMPVQHWRLVIEHPIGLALRVGSLGEKLEPTRRQVGDNVTLTFEKKDVAAQPPPELLSPPESWNWSQILITTGKSWSEVAQAYAAMVDAQIDQEDVQPLVKATVTAGAQKAEQIERLLAAVRRQVRYTSISFGESALAPANCLTRLSRRYGDCKDQSTLLVAMLRAAGHEAHVALVNTGRAPIAADFPAVNHFGHAIVYVPGDKSLWIDPAAGFSRVGELPMACQGKQALICRAGASELTRTPTVEAADNRTSNRSEIVIGDGEPGRGRHTLEFTGSLELESRHEYAQVSADAHRKAREESIAGLFGGAKVEKLEVTDLNDLSRPFKSDVNFAPVPAYMAIGEQWSYAIQPGNALANLPLEVMFPQSPGELGSPAEGKELPRRNDLVLPLPYVYEQSYHFVPPPGFVVKQTPADEEVRLGPAKLSWNTTRDGQQATVVVRFTTGPPRWSPTECEAFKAAFRSLTGGQTPGKLPLVVEYEHQAAQLLREQKYRDAFALAQQALRESPGSYAAHARLERMLADVGLFEASLELTQQVVEQHPDRWDGWNRLAQARLSNAVGQLRLPGKDVPAAIAAMRKSAGLAAAMPDAQFVLGNYLEFDDRGRHYGDPARLKEAAAIYEKLLDDPVYGQQAVLRLLVIHVVEERFKEIQPLVSRLALGELRVEWELVAAAALGGVDAARKESAEIADDSIRVRLLARAGSNLEFARQYEIAAGIYALAADIGGNATLRNAAKIVGKLNRYDPGEIPADDPRSIVQQLLADVITSPVTRQDLAPLFVGDLSRWRGSTVEAQVAQLDYLRAQLERLGSPAAIRDRLKLAEYQVKGSDAVGYRINVKLTDTDTTWFVVQSPEGFRILFVKNLAELGAKALERLEAGDKAAAAQWLDWVAEYYAPGANIFDAYATPPVAKLWSAGRHDDEADIRLAACALAAALPSPKAITVLEEARRNSEAGFKRLQIERALLSAYLSAGRPQDAEVLVDPLLARLPGNGELVLAKAHSCLLQGKAEAVLGLWATQLDRRGTSQEILEILAFHLGACGKYAEAAAAFEQIEKRERLSPQGQNARAWLSLFLPKFPPDVLRDAESASSNVAHLDWKMLHTLAALYAHDEQPVKAMQTLHRSILARPEKSLMEYDWYVVGRVAETYGLDDYARKCYDRVKREKDASQTDAFVLAQQRLKELMKK
jgi:tetratricopeptide (TPR) repeat protein